METSEDLERAIIAFKNMILKHTVTFDATVISVDMSEFSCTIDVSGTQYSGVPLKVLKQSQASLLEVPAVDSVVLVAFRDGNLQAPQIVASGECSSVYVTVGDSDLQITDSLFKFNGGSNGGLVLVNNLVTAYNSIVIDLNVIKAALNGLGVPIVITSTTKTASDFENTKIKQ